MNKIYQLPSIVANQIAAGEVVERPVSVVKECVENSLDAGASEIIIDISCGGLNSIRITDNGEGILPQDMKLAVLPHATSKIHNLADLNKVKTLGFRGEALASIASVAKFTLRSRAQGFAAATELNLYNEKLTITPCVHNYGTTVLVNDLFYNTPVRKKFLSSARTEFLAIDKLVRCFALSAPSVKIEFYHQGKSIFTLPSGNTEEKKLARLRKILGKPFIDAASPIEAHYANLHIKGFVAGPNYARSQQDRMWVYVNKRMVNDKLLNHAIKKAYQDKLHPGRFPVCVIHIELDPEEIDVNVHPTKHELRFHQPRWVHDALHNVIEDALNCQEKNPALAENPCKVSQNLPNDYVSVAKSNWQYSSWVNLNANFALLKKGSENYLLHVKNLQEILLLIRFKNTKLPLAARNLLVPISIEITHHLARLESSFDLFAQLGITLSWLGDKTLLIRTIPTITPNLDLKGFITQALSYKELTMDVLFQELVNHSIVALEGISEKDKAEWLDFLSHTQNPTEKYLKELSITDCEDFFYA
ncbi:MAG: hypothetical protein A3F18_05495 [Legionellales bacterium RIFCSPHIGHO2_12_FULL_37_14]|nr:MAG: hypothetical protein A3F18_05495 [Legionellales bacterium RIFCSPHIGHO2_12_FULL_37_14]